ncbi:MAG TPA: hypothetical protein VK771_06665 [Acidimicrobiia bacterium]|nr:hypothetical protein [Acidimicrobiia bacterium]
MKSEPRGWLVAVFEADTLARVAAQKLRLTGADAEAIRVGDPLDALTSVRGELREELNDVVDSAPCPHAGPGVAIISLALVASAGTTLAVPDTEPARHVLVRAGSVRIDVVGPDGRPVDTLRAHASRAARRVCRSRQERRPG